ncbi:MAG: metallophosphoesterase [Actinomycetota bacterium]|nr:metallophosphoesterase [Actinomycetota bacterium]
MDQGSGAGGLTTNQPGRFVAHARTLLVWFGAVSLVAAATIAVPVAAQADGTCGSSGGHALCVTVASTLSGHAQVTVTNSPNSGLVIATWIAGAPTQLLQTFAASPTTGDYSFVWPTEKYFDAAGTLRVQAGSTHATAVDVAVTLTNGNTTDYQHSPSDWSNYLPGAWTAATDPTVLAVGDGPSNEARSNGVAERIAAVDPPLFLFLGDLYETGTFPEFLNHYGVSSLDAPGAGTLWGAVADATQPTVGNHENVNKVAYMDYWHGRPLFTTFEFGGVLFLDMNSSASMSSTSVQYQLVRNAITAPTAPACIVAFWHKPAVISNSSVASAQRAIWALLADDGGDLLLVGHQHHMVEFKPLDASFNAGTSGAHLVQLVSGAGGHSIAGVSKTPPGARIAWSKGGAAGLVGLTLNGAGGGAAATGISWQFQDVNGAVLRSGSAAC